MKDSRTILFLDKYSVGAYLIHGGAAFMQTCFMAAGGFIEAL